MSATNAVRAISRIPAAELTMLLEASAHLALSLDIDDVLQTAIESAVEVLRLDSGSIYILDGDELVLGAATPPLPAEIPRRFIREQLADHPHVGRCISSSEPVAVDDWTTEPMTDVERAICEARGLRSILYVPLLVSDNAVGAFIVSANEAVRRFESRDIDLCRALSHEIGMALANAQLHASLQSSHDELESAYDATLEGWSLALEMRDDETQGHALRVSTLSVELARRVGVAEQDLANVRRGALLHDIGKMVVPDAILHKPGPLDEAEWAIMRRHPESGRDFLAKISYLRPALDIPYCHHERWDGSGYPQGLAGDAIPLSARIFAIVDAFDALTSDRPYRKAWTVTAALDYVRSQSGSHFDPDLAEGFLAMMDDQRACAG